MGEARRRRIARDGNVPLTLDQVKIGCELALLFMLWHVPRLEKGDHREGSEPWWYQICVEEMVKYPDNGYRYLWWWAMRTISEKDPSKSTTEELDEMRSYFVWKFENVNGRPLSDIERKL